MKLSKPYFAVALSVLIIGGYADAAEPSGTTDGTSPKESELKPIAPTPCVVPWTTDAQRLSYMKSQADVVVLAILMATTPCDAKTGRLQLAQFEVMDVLKGELGSSVVELRATCIKGIYDVFDAAHRGRTFALFLRQDSRMLTFVQSAPDAHILLPHVDAAIPGFKREYQSWRPWLEAKSYPQIIPALQLEIGTMSNKVSEPTSKDPEPARMLKEIQRFYPSVILVPRHKMNIEGLSGHYKHPLVQDRDNATQGVDLYLFPDRSYIYVEWADILPPTIFEKGNWTVTNGFVVIERDNSMTNAWEIADHAYLPYSLTNSVEIQVFLIGRNKDYSRWLDSLYLNHFSLERVNCIDKTDIKQLKGKMMKESWRPEFYE